MLHSFDVVVNDAFFQAEEAKKIGKKPVPSRNVSGNIFTCGGKHESAIFFILKQAFGVESLNHIGHARLRDFETTGDIDHAGVAFGINQLEDPFQVILDRG